MFKLSKILPISIFLISQAIANPFRFKQELIYDYFAPLTKREKYTKIGYVKLPTEQPLDSLNSEQIKHNVRSLMDAISTDEFVDLEIGFFDSNVYWKTLKRMNSSF